MPRGYNMFVTVKYGEDESKLFNINCRNEVLLYHIKKNCKMDRDEVIELSDEQGVVKNLRQNLNEYGYDYLTERETVILLRVDSCVPETTDDSDSVSDRIIFIPMLTTMTDNQEFIDALNPKDHLGSKSSLNEEDGKGKKSKLNNKKKETKRANKPQPPRK